MSMTLQDENQEMVTFIFCLRSVIAVVRELREIELCEGGKESLSLMSVPRSLNLSLNLL
jgi:hypothetical protein